MNWQEEDPLDFYLDFETVNECFYNPEMNILKSKVESDIIFMIGLGYIENNKWCYKTFSVENISITEERRIIDEFVSFVEEQCKKYPKNIPKMFHWSPAEIINFNHASDRHSNRWNKWNEDIIWIDMHNIFISEPIVVKGSLNFKLKDIGKAFYKLGLIQTSWEIDGPSDGLGAMMDSIKYYKNKSNDKNDDDNKKTFEMVTKYNEIDCKVMFEIISYLRKNHI